MTASQLNSFANDSSDPVSNSITYENGTSVQNNVTIASGQYFLVFYAYYHRASIQFGYVVSPNTPLSYGAVSGPLGSGLASFGILNNSGVVTPYEIRTTEIVGTANISSFQVETYNAGQYGVSPTGATLQLNTLLIVNNANGTEQNVYWVQNVPDFETGVPQVSFGDEIWNFTDENGYLSNQSITSTNFQNGGFVSPTGEGNSGPFVYNYNGPNDTYGLPMKFDLFSKESVIPNTGVLVQLGYLLAENGTVSSAKPYWFDNVTIVDPAVQSAYFDVSGKDTTPIGLFYDAELVFAGEGNLEVAHFTQFNASLGLFYQNSSWPLGVLSSFPSYYSFSGDTGEAVDDLMVTYSNGIASISTSVNPNYTYLGNASLTLNLQSSPSTTTTTTSTGKTTTTSTTSSTSNQASSSSSTQETTTSSLASTSTTTPSETTSVTTISTTSQSNLSPGNGSIGQGSSTISSNSTSVTSLSSNSSPTTSASATGSATSSESGMSSTTAAGKSNGGGGMPSWEWTAIGIVLGIIMASLVFAAMRRKPNPSAQPLQQTA